MSEDVWKLFAQERTRDTLVPHRNVQFTVAVWMDVLIFRKMGLIPGPPAPLPPAVRNARTGDIANANSRVSGATPYVSTDSINEDENSGDEGERKCG